MGAHMSSSRAHPLEIPRVMHAVRTLFILVLVLLALPAAAPAAERAVVIDPAPGGVTFTLGTTFHTVHGTMPLVGGTFRFDPATGAASGEVTVDARRAETGNAKRDKTMHADVLESERFPSIVFKVERVEGALAESGRSDLRLAGVMILHGSDHRMTLPATVENAGGRVRGTMQFPIPYVEWGMHDPSFLIARAEKMVDVTVRVEGHWVETPPVAAH